MDADGRYLRRLNLAAFARDLGAKLENPGYVYELWPYLVECGPHEDDRPPWASSRKARALRNLDELRHLCAACRSELAALPPDPTLDRMSDVLSRVAEKLNGSPEGTAAAAVRNLVETAEFAGGPELRGLAKLLDTECEEQSELFGPPQPNDGAAEWNDSDNGTGRANASRRDDPMVLRAALAAWHRWDADDQNLEPASAQDLLNLRLREEHGWEETRLSKAFNKLLKGGQRQYTRIMRGGNVKRIRDLLDFKDVRHGSADDLIT